MTAEQTAPRPLVGIVMGSDSDHPVMQAAEEALAEFGIETEVDVVPSAEVDVTGRRVTGRGV